MSAPSIPKAPFSKSAYVTAQAGLGHKAIHEYRDAPAHRTAGAQALRIAAVEPESLGERIGLKAGDQLLELDGKPLVDPVDFQFRTAEAGHRMRLRTADRTVTFVRRDWEQIGIEFEPIEPLVCANQCVFCFVHQNPKNVRRSLHIKDEDYRLSFLFGNYLTLTNVDEKELQRIIDQRLSPLYVSVHATEPELRAKLLGIPEYDGFMEKVVRLTEARITVHGQVVLCPGLNDGRNLERTIDDLAALSPGVASLAVVPVGLTKHRKNLPQLTEFTKERAQATIAQIEPIQKALQRRLGTPFVFLGDEIYIMAGQAIPPTRHYQEFPQIENGVGMVRTFLTEFGTVAGEWKRRPPKKRLRGTVCTGRVFHPFLKDCVDRLDTELNVIAVESAFWGPGIGVAGLLTGSDFIAALKRIDDAQGVGDFAVIPSECMIGEDRLFLDDLTLADVEREVGLPVLPSGYNAREFVSVLRGQANQ